MTTKEVAEKFVAMNRAGGADAYLEIYKELYSNDIVSIENWGDRDEYTGMDALKAKSEKFEEGLTEMHEYKISDPLVADQSFAVTHYMDVTFSEASGMPGRVQLTELGTYWVRDGKIVREEYCA